MKLIEEKDQLTQDVVLNAHLRVATEIYRKISYVIFLCLTPFPIFMVFESCKSPLSNYGTFMHLVSLPKVENDLA